MTQCAKLAIIYVCVYKLSDNMKTYEFLYLLHTTTGWTLVADDLALSKEQWDSADSACFPTTVLYDISFNIKIARQAVIKKNKNKNF